MWFVEMISRTELERAIFAAGHSIWIGGAMGILLWVCLRLMPARYAGVRYAMTLGALGLLVVSIPATYAVLSRAGGTAPAIVITSGQIQASAAPINVAPAIPAVHDHPALPAAQDQPDAAGGHIDWVQIAALLWAAGFVAMLIRMAVQLRGTRRLLDGAQDASQTTAGQTVGRLLERLEWRASIRVLLTPRLNSPAVLGIFRPVLLIPPAIACELTPQQLESILLHELAHIRRYDYLINIGQLLVEALLFFNPAVWLISRQVRIEREACCDAFAARITGEPLRYAEVLGTVMGRLGGVSGAMAATGEGAGHALDRVRRILVPGYRPGLRLSGAMLTGAVVAGLLLFVCLWRATEMAVAATQPAAAEAEADKIVTLTYDLGGLVQAETEEARATKLAEIQGWIVAAVEPGSWGDGRPGRIRPVRSTSLEITHTLKVQEQAFAFIENERARRLVRVRVQVDLVTVEKQKYPEGLLDLATKPLRKDGIVDVKQVEELKRIADSVVALPHVTVDDGYGGYLAITTDRNYVSGFEVTTRPDGSKEYKPQIDQVWDGVKLDVNANVAKDRKAVRVSVWSRVQKLLGIDLAELKPRDKDEKPIHYQKPLTQMIEHKGDIVVADGQYVCLGAQELEVPKEGQGKVGTWLVVLARATILTPTSKDAMASVNPPRSVLAPSLAAVPATRPTTVAARADDFLDRRLPEFYLDGMRYQDVVDYLRDKAELNITIDWPRLKEIGITPESKVQTHWRSVPVSKCLDELCRQPITSGRDHAAWVFDRGVITITTRSSLDHLITKVYDLGDIAASFDPSGQDAANWLDDVSTLVVSTVDTDTWEGQGGSGTLRTFKKANCLIISQTEEVHAKVDALLSKLRERFAVSVDIQLLTVELPVKQLPANMRDTIDKDKPLGWYPTDQEVADLVKTARANRPDAVVSAPRMMILNGGTSRVDIWTDVNYLGTVKATTRPGAAPVYEPEIGTTRTGMGVTVSAFVSHDRRYVRLQLKHERKRLLSMGEIPYKPVADAKESFTIQQPVTNDTSNETDVSVENGKTVCMMEQVITPPDGKGEPRALLLMATPRISIDTTMLAKPGQGVVQDGK